jgi:hypothetical protein
MLIMYSYSYMRLTSGYCLKEIEVNDDLARSMREYYLFLLLFFNFYMYIVDVALENSSTWFAIVFPMSRLSCIYLAFS